MTAGAHGSINRIARLAGGLYLSLVPFGFFSFVYVPSVLLVRGDAAATYRNIMASEWLFRSGMISHLISQVIVVFLVLALYRLLKPVNEDHGAFTSTQLHAQAMLFLEMHRSGILVAQVFWGLWLLPLGSLVFRSGFLPKLLGISVLIGAAGYLIDSGAHLLSSGVATISQFTFIGELLLPLWLLIKGVSVEPWQQVTVA